MGHHMVAALLYLTAHRNASLGAIFPASFSNNSGIQRTRSPKDDTPKRGTAVNQAPTLGD